MEEFAAQLDAAQLADLCCGTGWGVQDENKPVIGASTESVPGAAGETTHALESYGISSIVLADGPGGVRITRQFEATDLESGEKRQVYHYCTAWPEMCIRDRAYGMPDPNAIFTVAIAQRPGAEEVGVRLQVYLQNQYGQPLPVKVTAKDETNITFDANHEMAGKELNFEIRCV